MVLYLLKALSADPERYESYSSLGFYLQGLVASGLYERTRSLMKDVFRSHKANGKVLMNFILFFCFMESRKSVLRLIDYSFSSLED